jgi:hypothetical protein
MLYTLPIVITSTHVIIYADDAEQTRPSFRDVMEFPNVDTHRCLADLQAAATELGIHPTGSPGFANGWREVYLMCDDIHARMADCMRRASSPRHPQKIRGPDLLRRCGCLAA